LPLFSLVTKLKAIGLFLSAMITSFHRLHQLVPVWHESGAQPHPPHTMHGAYLERTQVVVGNYWQRYGWVAPVIEISHLEDGYGLAAGKPMLVGYLTRPAPDRESGLMAMIDSIRADAVASYRRFATPQERELCGGDNQH
jgi:hypothetical protein